MKPITSLLLALGLTVGCQPSESATTDTRPVRQLHVATNGNDAWSGGLDKPNRSATDGPLATVTRAVEKIRQERTRQPQGTNLPWTISVGPGTYFLKEPLVLRPEDSELALVGSSNRPCLSGGRRITGWQKTRVDGRECWLARIPETAGGKWIFHQLWVNGKRATRARHPDRGYLSITGLPDKTAAWNEGHARFQVRANDVKPWASLTNAEAVVMTRWVESRLPVMGFETNTLRLGKRSRFQLSEGDLYYLENVREALDQPGEWYLEPSAGTVYYLPREGEVLEQVEAIAPVLTQVVRLEGKPEEEKWVKSVQFTNLTFSHTEWYFPSRVEASKDPLDVGGFPQAAIGVPGAVWGEGVRQSTFHGCSFSRLGNYGLELARGCQDNAVLQCEFSDLGAGGIRLGETEIRNKPSDQSHGNLVSDCRIHDGGRMFHSAIGIWIGQSPYNRILYNEIFNFYYTGISIGWTWGYAHTLAYSNTVQFNHVHHIGVRSDGDGPILSDMGGIYTLGRQPGTRIANNVWHDIAGFKYGGWGIYFDEGSSGIVAESNLVYRTTHGGFHQHYGQTNIVRNNIFAFARDHQIQRTRPEPHSSFSFQTNIVYIDSGVLLSGDFSGDKYQFDSNLYFDARAATQPDKVTFAGQPLANWRARGHDRRSMVADPLFVAPLQNNFALQPGSPALRLGFKPINGVHVGPRTVLSVD